MPLYFGNKILLIGFVNYLNIQYIIQVILGFRIYNKSENIFYLN